MKRGLIFRGIVSVMGLLVFTTPNVSARIAAKGGREHFADEFEAMNASKWNTSNLISGLRFCADNRSVEGPGTWKNVSLSSFRGVTQSAPYGTVSWPGTEIRMSGIGRTFPYLVAGPPGQSPFPDDGDFVFNFRMRYPSLAPNGDGLVMVTAANSAPGGSTAPISGTQFLAIWGRVPTVSYGAVGGSASVTPTTGWHNYRLEYVDQTYSAYFDGKKISGPVTSTARPTTIWLGNPVFTWWGIATWSEIAVDYVKVQVPQMYISAIETRPRMEVKSFPSVYEPVDSHTLEIEFENLEPGEWVKVEALVYPDMGGHEDKHHQGPRPAGGFGFPKNMQTISEGSVRVKADQAGRAKIYYRAPGVNSAILITATSELDGHEVGEIDVEIKIPGLTLLPDGDSYVKVGGRCAHHGPRDDDQYPDCRSPDNNHWGTPALINAINQIVNEFGLAQSYLSLGNRFRLRINDMSLPWGGKFDLQDESDQLAKWTANWQRHRQTTGHSVGRAVDIPYKVAKPGMFATPKSKPSLVRDALEDAQFSEIPLTTTSVLTQMTFFDEEKDKHFHVMK